MKGDVLLERVFYYISLLWIGSFILGTGSVLAKIEVTASKGVPSPDYSYVTWKSVKIDKITVDEGKEIVDEFSDKPDDFFKTRTKLEARLRIGSAEIGKADSPTSARNEEISAENALKNILWSVDKIDIQKGNPSSVTFTNIRLFINKDQPTTGSTKLEDYFDENNNTSIVHIQ